jgi:ABC-type xylose transport system permease subunit
MGFLCKMLIFRGLEILYFSFLLPLKCHVEHLAYETSVSIHIGLITLLNTVIYVFFYTVCYRGEEMKTQAKSLGYWKQIKYRNDGKQPVEEWKHTNIPYNKDIVVTLEKKYYISGCKLNASIPGDIQSQLIYLIFHNHSRTRYWLLLIMCFAIMLQNVLMLNIYRGFIYILLILQSVIVFCAMIRHHFYVSKK